ncbi:peptidase family M3 protein [Toxoplasma gondii ME49]|uniref:Peptidase family M3 protein n=4 Tax=Toxoplasma gondii TaxID=5811 RepID=A0A2G8Y9X1_TOXGO|nr:peptidase family M3 protein [Toxoplasma gondii ME49]EPT27137.1 peptidase family M3 protein [Toxoplasma gondii ME49]KFG45350.1 peptidase family M3 protein [Toxoplasma gondii GAB2-2007-GAL-DOM2]PIM04065.1 peptidase family M3 protein [Toxoplasma gondii COUG]|eukprot:XP_002366295.1 peptidase family M3 protein [Toxoplasma gondii ME49]
MISPVASVFSTMPHWKQGARLHAPGGRFTFAARIYLFLLLSCLGFSCSGEIANGKGTDTTPARLDPRTLPRYNLKRHFPYSSIFDPAIDRDIEALSRRAREFKERFKGTLETTLLEALIKHEQLDEAVDFVDYYIALVAAVNTTNEEIRKRVNQLESAIAADVQPYRLFVNLELGAMPEAALQKQMAANGNLSFYSGFLGAARRRAPYVLSEDVERALLVRKPMTVQVATEYYFKQLGDATFDMNGEKLILSMILAFIMDNSQEKRWAAQKAVKQGLERHKITNFAALSLNVVAGSWHMERKERGYERLRSSRNVANNVSDKTIDALIHAGETVAVSLTKRYFKLKKKILKNRAGVEVFDFADRLAPLPLKSSDRLYDWKESTRIVRDAYKSFSPTMALMFDKLLEEERIDAPAVPGKRTPACYLGTPTTGPFIILEHVGQPRCVETLAHEAGHAIHSMLSYEQGNLQLAPPLTIAEMASLMGERIVFNDLLRRTTDPEERLSHLLRYLDGWTSTVTRQLMFDDFERRVHDARAQGTIPDGAFTTMWKESLEKYFGAEGEVFDSYANSEADWARIPHFHNTPFYVYAYAFSDLAVGSLYRVYKAHPEGFEQKYLDILRSGNKKSFEEIMKPFGLNPSAETFWADAVEATGGTVIDEAESLALKLGFV